MSLRFTLLALPLRRALRRIARDERGITLIELITSMAIMLTVVGALGTLFVSGSNAETNLNRRFQAQSNARLALSTLRREVHGACNVTVTTGASSQTMSVSVLVQSSSGAYTCTSTQSTWCTIGSSQRYKLYRKAGATCDSNGGRYADYLTTFNVFSRVTPTAGSLMLPKLGVDLIVNPKPSDPGTYRLADAIAVRNATRS